MAMKMCSQQAPQLNANLNKDSGAGWRSQPVPWTVRAGWCSRPVPWTIRAKCPSPLVRKKFCVTQQEAAISVSLSSFVHKHKPIPVGFHNSVCNLSLCCQTYIIYRKPQQRTRQELVESVSRMTQGPAVIPST